MAKLNSKTRWTLVIMGIVAILALILFLFLNSPLFAVTHSQKELHIEAGTKASTSPHTYLDGANWSVSFSYVDTSAVKHTKVGRYPVTIYHGFKKYTSYVNITDTTPPVVSSSVKNKTLIPGKTISAKSLGLDIQDYSEIQTIRFTKISSTKFNTGLSEIDSYEIKEAYRKGIPMEAEEFQFAYGGIYTMTISIQDAFYNTSELEVTLTVEEPPVLEVPNDFYVADMPQIDFADYIHVSDFIEADLDVSDVEIDTSKLNLSAPGTYPVTFRITDTYGLTSTKTSNVHVSSQDALQTLIEQHHVDITKDVVLGAKNPYDIGYFEEDNIIAVQKAILPCVAHIKNDALGSFGSGFIIEINKDFVTITTNHHVIQNDAIVDVTFYDGTSYLGSVVAWDAKRDIAFIRIPIDGNDSRSSISSTYVKTLKSVHINKGYWSGLADNCRLTIGYNCIDENGNVWNNNIGYIVEKEAIRDWNEFEDITETLLSFNPIPGTSGSALLDGHGQLMGMIRGYTNYDGYRENIAVPLSEILSYFEIVFKYKIHSK